MLFPHPRPIVNKKTAMNLDELRQNLTESQAAFLALLAATDEADLYKSEGDEWTVAETLVHMCEARTFYADAIGQLHKNPGMTIGRDLSHERRVGAIAEFGGADSAEIHNQLTTSHQAILTMLNAMTEADLNIKGHHPTMGERTVGEFIERFLVSHEKAHVQQASAI